MTQLPGMPPIPGTGPHEQIREQIEHSPGEISIIREIPLTPEQASGTLRITLENTNAQIRFEISDSSPAIIISDRVKAMSASKEDLVRLAPDHQVATTNNGLQIKSVSPVKPKPSQATPYLRGKETVYVEGSVRDVQTGGTRVGSIEGVSGGEVHITSGSVATSEENQVTAKHIHGDRITGGTRIDSVKGVAPGRVFSDGKDVVDIQTDTQPEPATIYKSSIVIRITPEMAKNLGNLTFTGKESDIDLSARGISFRKLTYGDMETPVGDIELSDCTGNAVINSRKGIVKLVRHAGRFAVGIMSRTNPNDMSERICAVLNPIYVPGQTQSRITAPNVKMVLSDSDPRAIEIVDIPTSIEDDYLSGYQKSMENGKLRYVPTNNTPDIPSILVKGLNAAIELESEG